MSPFASIFSRLPSDHGAYALPRSAALDRVLFPTSASTSTVARPEKEPIPAPARESSTTPSRLLSTAVTGVDFHPRPSSSPPDNPARTVSPATAEPGEHALRSSSLPSHRPVSLPTAGTDARRSQPAPQLASGAPLTHRKKRRTPIDLRPYALGGGDLGRIGATPLEQHSPSLSTHGGNSAERRLLQAIRDYVQESHVAQAAQLVRQGVIRG